MSVETFEKTPFEWDVGWTLPPPPKGLAPIPSEAWLLDALTSTMASSIDAIDLHRVAALGARGAALELLEGARQGSRHAHGWWSAAEVDGALVGFVMPVILDGERRIGSIYMMGVLPSFRGRGHALTLVAHATRVLVEGGAERILCDTDSKNEPMIRAFRRCGYRELAPWVRRVDGQP